MKSPSTSYGSNPATELAARWNSEQTAPSSTAVRKLKPKPYSRKNPALLCPCFCLSGCHPRRGSVVAKGDLLSPKGICCCRSGSVVALFHQTKAPGCPIHRALCDGWDVNRHPSPGRCVCCCLFSLTRTRNRHFDRSCSRLLRAAQWRNPLLFSTFAAIGGNANFRPHSRCHPRRPTST
jgi:hypothetical protein